MDARNSFNGWAFPYSSMTTSSSVSLKPASAVSVLCQTILQKKQALPHADCRVETALAESILTLNGELLDDTVALKTALETAPETDGEHMLRYYHDTIFAQMNKVRASIDKLETLVAGDYWPYPRYTDLLFSV